MKFYFDTEFIERPCTMELVSIGIVCEDGREYEAVSSEFSDEHADDWVRANVLAKLPPKETWKPRAVIKQEVIEFVGEAKPEFWAYYADYDWVNLCWLMGRMIDLPKGWPMYCRDLKQLLDQHGNPQFPKPDNEHDALSDARWVRRVHSLLAQKDKEERVRERDQVIAGLLNAVRKWGSEEDGIPDFALKAFHDGMSALRWEYSTQADADALAKGATDV